MTDAHIASLLRKHAATKDQAKRNELANRLRAAGVDPDAKPDVEAAPVERRMPEKVTADASSPEAPAKRGPGRPRKTDAN